MSRKTKKLLKAYLGWKGLKAVGKFGALPAAGFLAYRWFKDRDASMY